MTVALAGPYANLTAGQITTSTPHHLIFTGWMLFLTPNKQCQALKAMLKLDKYLTKYCRHKINSNKAESVCQLDIQLEVFQSKFLPAAELVHITTKPHRLNKHTQPLLSTCSYHRLATHRHIICTVCRCDLFLHMLHVAWSVFIY